jgi:hypothetical protein
MVSTDAVSLGDELVSDATGSNGGSFDAPRHDAVLGDISHRDLHVLVVLHQCVQVEIGDIKAAVFGTRCGESAVDDELGNGHVGYWSAYIANIFNEVTANGELNMVGFSLLRTNVDNNADIWWFLTCR